MTLRPRHNLALLLAAFALAVAATMLAGGCAHLPFVSTGPGSPPVPPPTLVHRLLTGSPNAPAWAVVALLSIGAMVAGLVIALVPIAGGPRPYRGWSITGAGLACLILSNVMRQWENALTLLAATLLLVGVGMVLWFLWVHRKQFKARAEGWMSLSSTSQTAPPDGRPAPSPSASEASA